jgi:CheY-like chemotaxis protein
VAESQTVLSALVGSLVDLATTCAYTSDLVRADPTQIEQVLFNLVANARDAMPGGGTIEIRTEVQHVGAASLGSGVLPGQFVVLRVSDGGVGMDPDTQARAFEPFFTTKEAGKGTGLGLNTVHRIVRRWDGRVQIESSPNVGTTVSVFLPAVGADVAAVEPARPPAATSTIGGRETVFVVEDEEAVAELVVEMLSSVGYHVIYAGHPSRAMDVCRRHEGTIDLLLTDLVMPEMGGVELAERIRSIRPGIRVLYMSGYADHFGATGGRLTEGMRLVSKPFDRRQLTSSVRDALDDRPVALG